MRGYYDAGAAGRNAHAVAAGFHADEHRRENERQCQKGNAVCLRGGGIRISPTGLVTIFSPTGIELKAPSLKYDGPESVSVPTPSFEKGAFKHRYKLHAGDDPEQILANKKFRLTSASGQRVEGVTDSCGRSPCSMLTTSTAIKWR